MNPNEAYINELYFDYLKDPNSVSPQWRSYFENRNQSNEQTEQTFAKNKGQIKQEASTSATPIVNKEVKPISQEQYKAKQYEIAEPMTTLQEKIAVNMQDSLEVPTATSYRTIPIKVLDENRRIINNHLSKNYKSKVSFTHIIAWAIVKGLTRYPNLNSSIAKINGRLNRLIRKSVNFGIAVDLEKSDGSRMLIVPNIKDADKIHFDTFLAEYDGLVTKARKNKLDLSDLQDTTVTLTNPGMIGTAYSAPRLMKGQGCIIGIGSIDYPTEFQAVAPAMLSQLAISKVVTISNTYDHRIIQGAESAEFLAYIHKLLLGEENFYDQIFYSLNVPFEAYRWVSDKNTSFNNSDDLAEKTAHINQMINAYRVRGHLLASTNPLGVASYNYPELDPSFYGFTIWDLDRKFHVDDSWADNNITLRETLEILRDSYCGQTSIEFMHIQDFEKKNWIKKYFENARGSYKIPKESKVRLLKKIALAENFENFLHTKFIGTKRFSLEGAESLIALMDVLLENSADLGLHSVVIGMAHRGRLNVLANILGKSIQKIFREFEGDFDDENYQGSGDVKYHLGYNGDYSSQNGNKLNVHLAANPSHLEMVDPVVEGIAHAISNKIQDKEYHKVMPILVHGDASFAGQGVVMETLNLSELDGYATGGTIHIIVNNQIGFTTNADQSRSTYYSTDIAKMIQAPIIHVNGDNPEAVAFVAEFAFWYRKEFHSDIVIDLLCYRKYGHNEADEPTYTQPLLYRKIKQLKPISRKYSSRLIDAKVLSNIEVEKIYREISENLQNEFDYYKENNIKPTYDIHSFGIDDNLYLDTIETKVPEDQIKFITDKLTTVPPRFNINPKVKSLLDRRNKMVYAEKSSIDWGMAELLAYGSLLLDNRDVRLSGQDSQRGTFSHRHSVWVDFLNEDRYNPLNHLSESQGSFRVLDSPLSEYAVLGFEYGYSLIEKDGLTIWEAQFGDFSNNAIPIVDQYLACGETKWSQYSNLTMFLPHSYDGQGPEHSSGRPERYLQLCAENNMIVCNITSPANFFHLLRRQAFLPKRVPLIVFTPKSMLRHPLVSSDLKEFTNGNFLELIDNNSFPNDSYRKLVFLTGKAYYDVLEALHKKNINDIAIIRLEQLYPLDNNLILNALNKYSNAREVVWFQEEPKNQGYWNHIAMYFNEYFPGAKIKFIGRKASSATATGSSKIHILEQNYIINKLLE